MLSAKFGLNWSSCSRNIYIWRIKEHKGSSILLYMVALHIKECMWTDYRAITMITSLEILVHASVHLKKAMQRQELANTQLVI